VAETSDEPERLPPGMQELATSDLVRARPATARDQHDLVAAAFETYHQEVFGFLRRGTRDETAAEDLLQDAFVQLAGEVGAGRTPENVRAWLYRVAANLVISRARRRKTVVDWLSRQVRGNERTADGPETVAIRRERSLEVETVLGSLPADARTALLLASEGFSGQEIAEAIGRTEAATRAMMCRARVRARLEFERNEGPE
jgi:RNA polymerase sigma-70 factor (ECF subfamily)